MRNLQKPGLQVFFEMSKFSIQMLQFFIFYLALDVGVLYIVRASTIYHRTSCTTIPYEKWFWIDVFGMKMFHLLQIHSKSASALTISIPFWNILFIADISTYSRWCCHATLSISFNAFFHWICRHMNFSWTMKILVNYVEAMYVNTSHVCQCIACW